MTPEDVGAVARQHGSDSFKAFGNGRHWATHGLREGGTVFWLKFEQGRLTTVQEGKYFGVTGLRVSVREQLCTGVTTADVTVRVTAPSELAGASMAVDGVARLGLSHGPQVQATVGGLPSGKHVLRIEKPGFEPILKEYNYVPTEYWPKNDEIDIEITEQDLRRTGETPTATSTTR
jgi:hypothetical protein